MRNPKKLYTKSGYLNFLSMCFIGSNFLCELQNDADDLHIDEEDLKKLYEAEQVLKSWIEKEDWEEDE